MKAGCLTIAAQRGFNGEFLSFFHRVTAEDGSACGRSIKDRTSIVIEDVMLDGQFAPYRTIALEAGFRAVQSTPIISRSGAFFGVISTHFPVTHRPSDREMLEMRALGEMTADAIIRQRIEGKGADGRSLTSTEKVARQISRAYEALADSYELLRHVTYQ